MQKMESPNTILQGDCIQAMQKMAAGAVDLVFADPPFNIGYEYDVYQDKKQDRDYLQWSREWMGAVHRVLKPDGTFWLAIGDEYAAELKIASQEIGFVCRSWVIWYYTFGVNCKSKFSRSHAHLFYFVKDPKRFTFRSDALENRIPSARQLVYADNRANPVGRLPDDTWVLRPQDLADCFTTAEDTWYFPRVAGTFKERAGFHGCQMPEQLLGRIIRHCSNAGDLVLDPFSGSATTVVVAKKLGRRYLGMDLSQEYVSRGLTRLEGTCLGDPLEGALEPTMSAPATPKGSTRKKLPKQTDPEDLEQSAFAHWESKQRSEFFAGLIEAYAQTYDGWSLDRLVADPEINERFGAACQYLGLPGDRRSWNWSLFGLRKAGLLAHLPTVRRTEFSWDECDDYLFASEIAWRRLIDRGCESLDTILCDPALAAEFDEIAESWAKGFSPLQFRWAALKLRKSAKNVRSRASLLADAALSKPIPLKKYSQFPEGSGLYVVVGPNNEAIYAGEALRLRERLEKTGDLWKQCSRSASAKFHPIDCPCETRLAYQRRLVLLHRPALNLLDQKIA